MTTQEEILAYWFGKLSALGLPATDHNKLWFGYSEVTDSEIAARFSKAVEQAIRGELDHWTATDQGLIAQVILLDQFTRNIYRGTPAAFSGDELALALAGEAVAAQRHLRLPVIYRVFLAIPFEHSEELSVQEEGVAIFSQLLADKKVRARPELKAAVTNYRDYAVAHRDVIAQFGRFPHRNAILGRTSSQAELDYLAEHGGF